MNSNHFSSIIALLSLLIDYVGNLKCVYEMFLSFSGLSYKKSEYGLFIEINVYRKVSRALMFVSKQCLCICLT